MVKAKSLLRLTAMLVALGILFVCVTIAKDPNEPLTTPLQKRADLIVIDNLKQFGNLERPEVAFPHDMHTDALEKINKDCSACHLKEDDRTSPKFKRLKDIRKNETMDIYHANCMGCHTETFLAGSPAGPTEECGECHRSKERYISSRVPMGFDKSLHFRHAEANNNLCETCHHEYNNETKKLFYAKDKEGTCRYCHKDVTEKNSISMRLASHLSCIECHKKESAKSMEGSPAAKKTGGPVTCSGCHDIKKQKTIKKVMSTPRMKRNQPDHVLLQAIWKEPGKQELALKMNPVPFDHKAHEDFNDTCRVCHHAALDSCSKSCHTADGTKEGEGIKLERAMHLKGTLHSCLGCHATVVSQKNCAGCHGAMEADRKSGDKTCSFCHMTSDQESQRSTVKPEEMAGLLLGKRAAISRQISSSYPDKDIPEKVTIGYLRDQYEPVEFPHRQIVHTLLDNIDENKLAGLFHSAEGTICQGCHHNSPPAKKPPLCGNCHGKPFDVKNPFMPGIRAAYHQQCMECHREMNIPKPAATACTECHRETKG